VGPPNTVMSESKHEEKTKVKRDENGNVIEAEHEEKEVNE